MAQFRVTVHGSNFAVSLPPDGELIRGFVTYRRVTAQTGEDACARAEEEVRNHPTIKEMIEETEVAHNEKGLWRIESRDAERLSFLRKLLPKKPPGFAFYQNDRD